MNISEFAKQMGTSKTTLYRKIAAAGVELEKLRGDDGQLTDAGMSILAGVLDGSIPTGKTAEKPDESHEVYAGIPAEWYTNSINELRRERDELREKLAAAQEQITALQTAAAERAEAHAAELADILRRQQVNEEKRLTLDAAAPAPSPAEYTSFLGRLRFAFFGGKK